MMNQGLNQTKQGIPGSVRLWRACALGGVLWLLAAGPLQAQTLSKAGKNWKVKLNIGTLINDNVAQNPGGAFNLFGQDGDSAFSWSGSGEYLHTFNDRLSLKGEYQIDQTVYSDLGQYDLLTNSWGLRPRYKFDRNAFLDFQYFYIWSVAGGNSFSGVNYFSPTYSRLLGKWGLVQARFFYANTDNFRNQARDADEFGGGLDYVYIFQGTRNYLGIGYQGVEEDTAGRFDRTRHEVKLRGQYLLPYDIRFKGRYRYSFRDYDTFASSGGGVRQDNQHNFNFSVSKVLMNRWEFLNGLTGAISWIRITNDSNALFREYESNQVTFTLTAGF